ncbi:MAG TPA: glycosyltransferase [Candidatus Kapabacteria bacterium]|nr:glycosyltransferase [Candidatus Kapabacteria bacterium]
MTLVILSIVYFVVLACFVVGIRRGLRRNSVSAISSIVKKVSVVVCARNEEKNIDECLESLSKLDYPAESLQIVVVDDHSDDRTGERLQYWKTKLTNLEVISLRGEPNEGGKVNALIKGINAAKGEFVFISDADCEVPAQWIKEYLLYYDEDTGMVSSVTILNSNKVSSAVVSIEMMQLLGMSMSGINMGISVSIIGNNLSLRRQAYIDIGGYESIPFSVTEDVALFQAMWRSKWKVKFKVNKHLLVRTKPPGSLASWWRQKQRWVIGAKELGFIGWFILALGYLGMAASIFGFFLLPLQYAILTLLIKWAGDLLIVFPMAVSLRQKKLLWSFPFYQVYLLFFLVCVPFQYFQKTVVWKGRDYHT